MNRWKNDGLVKSAPPSFNKWQMLIEEGRRAVHSIRVQLATPLPLPYMQLLCFVVHLNHVFVLAFSGYSLAAALHGTEDDTKSRFEVVIYLVLPLITPVTFQSLLHVAMAVEDPFEGGFLDFSRRDLQNAFTENLDSLIQAGT